VAALALRLAQLGHAKEVSVRVAGGEEAARALLAFLDEMGARAQDAQKRDGAGPDGSEAVPAPAHAFQSVREACAGLSGVREGLRGQPPSRRKPSLPFGSLPEPLPAPRGGGRRRGGHPWMKRPMDEQRGHYPGPSRAGPPRLRCTRTAGTS
jgi:hypothetical protein